MKRYAKCIDKGLARWLTNGKIYEVVQNYNNKFFDIWCDIELLVHYEARHFQIVGCPCDIKGCIKHRVTT